MACTTPDTGVPARRFYPQIGLKPGKNGSMSPRYAGPSSAIRPTPTTTPSRWSCRPTADLQEALNAAAAVGDDTIQKQAGMRINEAGFTHGSAAQRQQWFTRGYQTGDPKQCNTFG